jgi:hypothetical protein
VYFAVGVFVAGEEEFALSAEVVVGGEAVDVELEGA